jgi:protein-disulfide isomerase
MKTFDTVANILIAIAALVVIAAAAPQVKQQWWSRSNAATIARNRDIRAVSGVRLSLPAHGMKGSLKAKVALIEFSDFQCPFCGRYARESSPAIQKEFVDSGKVVYVFRHLPLQAIHPFAVKAAQAAECAGMQNQFWPMHDLLFQDQHALDSANLRVYAQRLGLDLAKFGDCLDAAPDILGPDIAEARRIGITSTPTFLIGAIQADRTVEVLSRINGAQPLEVLRTTLESAVQKLGKSGV